jgi:hypothetical protein
VGLEAYPAGIIGPTGATGATGAYTYQQKSANYAAAAWELVATTANGITITLPTSPAAGTQVAVQNVTGSSGSVTVQRGGTNALNVPPQISGTSMVVPNGRMVELVWTGVAWFALGPFPLQWTALPFSTGWQAYETPTPGVQYQVPGYSIDADGVVRLRGPVTKTTTITLGSQIAILPAGFRPSREQWFPIEAEFGAGNRAAFLLQVCGSGAGVNGSVNIFDVQGNAPSGGGFPGTYVFLDPISFEALA